MSFRSGRLPTRERATPGASESAESEERYHYARQIEAYIKTTNPEFRFYYENLATVALAPINHLRRGGTLCSHSSNLTPPSSHLRFLSVTSPFCRHYMLHLDPNNLKDPKWQPTILKPLDKQPELKDIPYEDVKAWDKAMEYHSRFEADPDCRPVPRNTAVEAECLTRDENACVVTGKTSPRVFYFIPFTWNDTVEHMNATGSVHDGSILTNTSLTTWPDPPVSVQKLGATHKLWNMLSIDPVLYNYFKDGLCAFKYLSLVEVGNNAVQVNLEFHWMPRLKPRFGQMMDLERDWKMVYGGLDRLHDCPQESQEYGKVQAKSRQPLQTGHVIARELSRQDAGQFVDAVNVHWASVSFTAFCGGAGHPWLLSGKDPKDTDATGKVQTGE